MPGERVPSDLPSADDAFYTDEHVYCAWNPHPLNPGHAGVVPRRKIANWWEATSEEKAALFHGIEIARQEVLSRHQADGFNIGWNDGHAAGQTTPQFHIHVIPRLRGDVEDPRAGVRSVVPKRATWWKEAPAQEYGLSGGPPHQRGLVHGEKDDPFVRHLRAYFPFARQVDIVVAFVFDRGVEWLWPHLEEFLDPDRNKGRLRLVTGDYLGATDPNGLERLLDLPGNRDLRVFETGGSGGTSFHPKAYIFHLHSGGGVAFVGSSNMSRTALGDGVEWNYRVVSSKAGADFDSVQAGFERLFQHQRTRVLNRDWIGTYRASRKRPAPEVVGAVEEILEPATPHRIQQEALVALDQTRVAGNTAGLVVLATGLGKTWLSAFDSVYFERVLFVAHRDEILDQALATFRRIRPEASLGKFTGKDKAKWQTADVLFASIQTLGRARHLSNFRPDHFDYIVVDEFHHAAARTYRQLIEHFDPRFLLGLTATPERTDGADLLALCGYNLVFRCDLGDGIRQDLLCPFHYFGVPDDVDYAQIPWRSSKFDEAELTTALATQKRARNALEQCEARGGTKALGFCCSQKHADFMAEYFREHGKRAVSVHSGETSAPRTTSLEELKEGKLDIVFSVDMFNEGVDLPDVDTVLMLRPTESRILWLQQFGRGLRTAEGKDRLRVIDYIGNHRIFLNKPAALLGSLLDMKEGHESLRETLLRVQAGEAELPPGCEVTYELEAVNILNGLVRPTTAEEDLRQVYDEFRERHDRRPTVSELHGTGCLKKSVLKKAYGSWFKLVDRMGDLGDRARRLLASHGAFFQDLETTKMERSYKMLVLQAMLECERLPGEIAISDLASRVERIAKRTREYRDELAATLADGTTLESMLRSNPLRAWAGTKRGKGSDYFEMVDDESQFVTKFAVDGPDRETFAEMVRELVDWRLLEYLERMQSRIGERFVCRVTHNQNKNPILMLPDRDSHPGLPEGVVQVHADQEVYDANFAKIALNVVRKATEGGSGRNYLPDILRGWFGSEAGRPGRGESVVVERVADGYAMSPVGLGKKGPSDMTRAGADLVVGRRYMREEIAPLLGEEFKNHWRQGFLSLKAGLLLLVTLDKSGKREEYHYGDRFLSPSEFHWQSQNQTTQEGKHGREISGHRERGLPVFLFVRKRGKRASKAAPFVYCGEVDFERWEGEKPISVWWRLKEPLSEELWVELGEV